MIVLGIIGVIAEMTIPTLMNSVQNQNTVVSVKKAYSTLFQAYRMATTENGTPDNWGLAASSVDAVAGAQSIVNPIIPYLKIIKKCDNSSGCFPTESYKYLKNDPWTAFNPSTSAILADGSILTGWSYGGCGISHGATPLLEATCGEYFVDVNGFKKPNQLGVDVFYFYLTKNGIVPVGTPQESTGTEFSFADSCAVKSTAKGRGCTAWVIYNENLDYLKCDDLAWDGKTKCS